MKYVSVKDQMLKASRRSEVLQARQGAIEVASSIAFVSLAETGVIDDVTATEHTNLFSPWEVGIQYKVGDLRQHEEGLYRCVQSHTSQADWAPDATPALWAKVGDPTAEYPEWSQPIGAHDAYSKGDKCSHSGKKWVSTVDGNVWEPGVYGWEEVK